ncbi:hypothetical protein ACFL5B_02605, partial [Candidatus Latescibacterota bacterium]
MIRISTARRAQIFFAFAILITAIVSNETVFSEVPRTPVPDELKSILRKDHPRIFFNSETLPAIKARALNEEAELFHQITARVDKLNSENLESIDYGNQSAEAALVYLITEDEKYLELSKKLLGASLHYYHECYAEKKPVNWYSSTRINAWAAYDWIFN